MTIIQKDFLGLYVIAGGYICRPFNGTIFKENDKVKTRHFGGTTKAAVTFLNERISRNSDTYEIWCTTGIIDCEYDSLSKEQIIEDTEWYRQRFGELYVKSNNNFKEKFQKL